MKGKGGLFSEGGFILSGLTAELLDHDICCSWDFTTTRRAACGIQSCPNSVSPVINQPFPPTFCKFCLCASVFSLVKLPQFNMDASHDLHKLVRSSGWCLHFFFFQCLLANSEEPMFTILGQVSTVSFFLILYLIIMLLPEMDGWQKVIQCKD